MKNKLLIICGPTATGKTSLGVKLAKKFNGEIVSADSRQVYKGMDIATGKDLPKKANFKKLNSELGLRDYRYDIGYYLFDQIPVWLLDAAKPDQLFTVADYFYLVWAIIKDIWRRKKLPIIVGGTGFYLKAATEGLDTMGIAPDWLLRKELQNFTVFQLQEFLNKVDREKLKKMNQSDRVNPRRLIRALEIALHRKRKSKKKNDYKIPDFDAFWVGLGLSFPQLYKRIDERIELQFKQGTKKEVEKLVSEGYSWELPSMTAMGYGEWRDFFEGKKGEEEIIERWKYNEHGYARRQVMWFKKMPQIKWFDIQNKDWELEVEKFVKDWYS